MKTMADGPEGSESGAEFRAKFEARGVENEALRGQLAEQFGVPAAQLKDVPVDQIATRATEIKAEALAAQEATLKQALEAKGLSGDDLDAALASLKAPGEQPAAADPPASQPFSSAAPTGGTPPGHTVDPGLTGRDRIRAALNKKK